MAAGLERGARRSQAAVAGTIGAVGLLRSTQLTVPAAARCDMPAQHSLTDPQVPRPLGPPGSPWLDRAATRAWVHVCRRGRLLRPQGSL